MKRYQAEPEESFWLALGVLILCGVALYLGAMVVASL